MRDTLITSSLTSSTKSFPLEGGYFSPWGNGRRDGEGEGRGRGGAKLTFLPHEAASCSPSVTNVQRSVVNTKISLVVRRS